MILKWQSYEGVWHVLDGVTDIINHGWKTPNEIHELATKYDGTDTCLHWTLDAKSKAVESTTNKYHYVVAMIHGDREHLVMESLFCYLLSDAGKTVDKLH